MDLPKHALPIWKLAKGASSVKCSLMPGQLVTQHNPRAGPPLKRT